MTPERWETIGNLYEQALHCTPEQRAALLDRACAGDPELRREVESMVAAYEADPDFLEQPALPIIGPGVGHLDEAGWDEDTYVGPYRLVRPLGQGGMGEVFLAVRDLGSTRQTVALKLLRTGLPHDDLIHRFTAEQQILAQLTHSHVARLLDAGQADDGRPYLVMEYVDGAPITDYCDRHRLTIDQRLRLFVQVCEAVQFAHQHLVIHRDLKPSNILVTAPRSGSAAGGQVKLLDFGIAKMLDPLATNAPLLQTRTGQRLLTPAYASPEQIDGASIATTSDVYSLGVLLYELLAGQRPYTLDGKTESEIARIIVEETPTRPSAAVTQPAPAPTAIGDARKSSPERLRRHLRGDLDTIVMKALRKEPGRRYQSAADLADDLERHLSGLPVRARPDTLGYRTRKFVRRHRWTVAAASVAVLLLLVFSTVTAMQSARIQAQAQSLILERDRAQAEAAKAEQVTAFLADLFKGSDPTQAQTLTAREILDQGRDKIQQDLHEQPAVRAQMLMVIGGVYRSLGLYDEAQAALEEAIDLYRALGDRSEAYASALLELSNLHYRRNAFDAAEPLAREAVTIKEAVLGPTHTDVAKALNTLALILEYTAGEDSSIAVLRRVVEIRRDAPTDAPDVDLAANLNNLANMLHNQQRLNEARPLYEEALEIVTERWGPEHPYVAFTLNSLAALHQDRQAFDAARQQFDRARRIAEAHLEPDHPFTAVVVHNQAKLSRAEGALEAAAARYREAVTLRRALTTPLDLAESLVGLGWVLLDLDRPGDAAPYLREAVRIYTEQHGADHPRTQQVRDLLAQASA
ncbi:MAG: tetratricopeptide repeat protein [Bacteroidetes bacterium]|jgi:serine/threonine-protein kinase|nr:tetratricopeptide repeat protein [Bacteroidota bacterium]